jgi:hypothetical protein
VTISEVRALKRHEAIRRRSTLVELLRRVEEEIAVLDDHINRTPKRGERPRCGTERGYQWHRHHDRDHWPLPTDDPCGCREAHRVFERARARARDAA